MTFINMDVRSARSILFLMPIIVFFSACQEEENGNAVITLDPEVVNNTTVRLRASFNVSPGAANEYGFVWDALSNPDYDTRVISFNVPIPAGEVIAELNNLDFEQIYYVRVYSKKGPDITYGGEKSFTFGGLMPEITKLLPGGAHWGDTIAIVGKNFTPIATRMTIQFGNLLSEVVSGSADTVRCVVPVGLSSGTHPVIVKVGKHTSPATQFTLLKPAITTFAPPSGTFLDIVVIQGSDFHVDASHNVVRFGSARAEVLEASPDALSVRVPTSLNEASSTISVQVDSQRVNASEHFVLASPVVTGVQPNAERIGNTIKITGANFNPAAEHNRVLFGSNRADVTEASSTELTVRVPNGIYHERTVPTTLEIAGMQLDLPAFTIKNAWIRKEDIAAGQYGRFAAQGFAINGIGYAGLGEGAGIASAYEDFYKFDAETNSWTRIADYGGGKRSSTASFIIDDVAYIGTGSVNGSGKGTNDFYRYDAESDSWMRIADFPGNPATKAVGFSVNGKGYLCLASLEDNFWEYDPALDEWTQKKTLVTSPASGGKTAVGAFVLKGRAFVLTSRSSNGELYEYDYINDDWIRKDNVSGMRSLPAVVATATHAYYQSEYNFFQYDIDTDTWKLVDFDPVPFRFDAFFFSIGQKIYLGGGLDNSNSYRDFWECETSLLE